MPVYLKSFTSDREEVTISIQKYKTTRINLTPGQQASEGDLLFVIKPLIEDNSAARITTQCI